MTKPFPPPLSGPVLGRLVEAFDLRRLDRRHVLVKRNSRRYLAGERVSPEAEAEVHDAIAAAILEADLLPPWSDDADTIPRSNDASAPDRAALEDAFLKLPRSPMVRFVISESARCWDQLAGALRRLSAPVAFPEQAAGACLRLVAIDVAVRLTAVLWLARAKGKDPIPTFWFEERGTSTWLRALHEKCSPPLSRNELAKQVKVHAHTLDGWLDADVRPADENLMDLAHCFAARGLGVADDLLRKVRLAFAARELFRAISDVVGRETAIRICGRVVTWANGMLALPRGSKNTRAENDIKMKIAFMHGRAAPCMPWVESMLTPLWRGEPDPVWRTSLKAATRSWLAHLQETTAKLGPDPTECEAFLATFGEMPAREELEMVAYTVQASKEELARNPLFAMAMAREAEEMGRYGALELKIQGTEAANRGDLLGAIDKLRSAAERDPLNAEIHFRLGCCFALLGDVPAGLSELEISVQLDPGWDRARVEIGIVLLVEGREEEALRRLLESRAALKEPSGWLLLNLAYAYERNGALAGAIQTYEDLLIIEPDNAEALDRLAHLYFVAKERRRGADAAKRAAQLGVPTVFYAMKNGLYDKCAPAKRPPHYPGVVELLHFQADPDRMPQLR